MAFYEMSWRLVMLEMMMEIFFSETSRSDEGKTLLILKSTRNKYVIPLLILEKQIYLPVEYVMGKQSP